MAALCNSSVGPVYRYLYRHLFDRAEAEDLTQEVLLRAWRRLPFYRVGETPFAGYLLTIARNLLRSHYRRHPSGAAPLEEAPEPMTPDWTEDWTDRELLRTALGRLGAEQREVVVARILEGRSAAETAALLGKTPEAVRAQQYRALKRLEEILVGLGWPGKEGSHGVGGTP